MTPAGTIDEAAFRVDLAALSQNDYPQLQLVKLPFNWYAPQTAGIRQYIAVNNAGVALFPSSVQNGSAILVFLGMNSLLGTPTTTVTDSQGNVYTKIGGEYGAFSNSAIEAWICLSAVGGATTVTGTSSWGLWIVEAIEIGGVASLGNSNFNYNSSATTGNTPGALAISCCTPDGTSGGTFTESSGWALLNQINASGLTAVYCTTQTVAGSGNTSNAITYSGGGSFAQGTVVLNLSAGGAAPPPPITPISLPGPCNFLALVSEAIDEHGQYVAASLIGQQAAAGYMRLNGDGNVWFPMSYASPLMTGYVTTNDDYALNPIAGTGFSALEGAFGQLDWRPSVPVYYGTPNPPSSPAGYLLALVGLSVGVGSSLGDGNSSTYAVPSSAGPVSRLKAAGVI